MATTVRELNYTQAVNEALRQEMRRDPNTIIIGEDISGAGGRKHLGFGDGWVYATMRTLADVPGGVINVHCENTQIASCR